MAYFTARYKWVFTVFMDMPVADAEVDASSFTSRAVLRKDFERDARQLCLDIAFTAETLARVVGLEKAI